VPDRHVTLTQLLDLAQQLDGDPAVTDYGALIAAEARHRVGPAQLSLLPLADVTPAEPATGAPEGPGPVADGGGTLPLFTNNSTP